MAEINSVYKKANYFEGRYENGRVFVDKKRSILIKIMIIIDCIIILTHSIIFISDNKFIKDHFPYFKLSDSHDLNSKYLTLAGGFIIWSVNYPVFLYRRFTKNSNGFKPLSFLFCLDVHQMTKTYHMTRTRAKEQIRLQLKFFKNFYFMYYFYAITFGFLIAKNCYQSVMKTSFSTSNFVIWMNTVKILSFFIFFYFSFRTCSLRFLINLSEMLLSCEYLKKRLEDQQDLLSNVFKDKTYANRNKLTKQVLKVIKNYNLIFNDKNKLNKHFNQSMKFTMSLLFFTVIYPTISIYDPTRKMMIYFWTFNALLNYLFFSSICYYNRKFIHSVSSF